MRAGRGMLTIIKSTIVIIGLLAISTPCQARNRNQALAQAQITIRREQAAENALRNPLWLHTGAQKARIVVASLENALVETNHNSAMPRKQLGWLKSIRADRIERRILLPLRLLAALLRILLLPLRILLAPLIVLLRLLRLLLRLLNPLVLLILFLQGANLVANILRIVAMILLRILLRLLRRRRRKDESEEVNVITLHEEEHRKHHEYVPMPYCLAKAHKKEKTIDLQHSQSHRRRHLGDSGGHRDLHEISADDGIYLTDSDVRQLELHLFEGRRLIAQLGQLKSSAFMGDLCYGPRYPTTLNANGDLHEREVTHQLRQMLCDRLMINQPRQLIFAREPGQFM